MTQALDDKIKRIGFACKVHTGDKKTEAPFNFNTTTVKALSTKLNVARIDTLHRLGLGNIDKLENLLKLVASYDSRRRMVRIGSEVLPLYTHAHAHEAYADKDFINTASTKLKALGDFARVNGIRLSMHPGQFTVLGSLNEDVVAASIEELEYHTMLFVWMGYSGWHDNGVVVNIHGGSGKVPLDVFIKNVSKCSSDCRNFITVENDEFSFDISDLTTIAKHIAIVPDLHHEWVHNGHYLEPEHELFEIVLESWRGVRAKLHCAMSKDDVLGEHAVADKKPELEYLLANGFNKSDLRAHSDGSWNTALIEYYSKFMPNFDIMCEMKHKQVGSEQFFNYLVNKCIDI